MNNMLKRQILKRLKKLKLSWPLFSKQLTQSKKEQMMGRNKIMVLKYANILNKVFVKKAKNVNSHTILSKMQILIFILIKENKWVLSKMKKKTKT